MGFPVRPTRLYPPGFTHPLSAPKKIFFLRRISIFSHETKKENIWYVQYLLPNRAKNKRRHQKIPVCTITSLRVIVCVCIGKRSPIAPLHVGQNTNKKENEEYQRQHSDDDGRPRSSIESSRHFLSPMFFLFRWQWSQP